MSYWVNRTVLSGSSVDPNGTNSHTCSFTAATSGNLLVAVVAGSVTSTTPTGWTLVKSVVDSTGVYVFSKTAGSGESSFSTTHNASDYPIRGVVYEFPSTMFVFGAAGSASSNSATATGPNCTGLTGTYLRFAVRSWGMSATNSTASASWTLPTVKDYDDYTPDTGSVDGIGLSIAYDGNVTGSSFTPSSTYTVANTAIGASQDISFAVSISGYIPAPAFVQGHADGNAGSSTTLTSTYDSSVSAGNLLVIAFSYGSTSATPTVSDSLGTSYKLAVGPTDNGALGFRNYIYYGVPGSGGSNTVTVTASTSVPFRRILIHEYANADTLDVTSAATGNGGLIDSGSVTTTYDIELLFGWGLSNNGTTSPDGNYTLRETALSESTEDQVVNAIGSYNASFPADSSQWICQLATFYLARAYNGTPVPWLHF